MKYLMIVLLMCTAFFVTACDERPHIDVNGSLGAGGLFSQDSEGNGRNGSKKATETETCELVVEQRCFETCFRWIKINNKWKLRNVLSIQDLCTIEQLLTSTEETWRIQNYIAPIDYNEGCPEWYHMKIGAFIIDIRCSIVLERVVLQPCNS